MLLAACASTQRAQVQSAIDARRVPDALAAYERMRASEGADPILLAKIAAALLEAEALSDDQATSAAAFAQLTAAGTAARDTLRRLSAVPGKPVVNAHALSVLATHGDNNARTLLRASIDASDSDIRAYAITSLEVIDDAPLLVAALGNSSGAVRLAAANVAAPGPIVPELFAALVGASRNDPLPAVRAACIRALGRAGTDAVETLRERLSDVSEPVRMAAIGALAQADRVRARDILTSLLGMGANPASLEAARVLAAPIAGDERGVIDARAFLLRGLASTEVPLRTQSAVALAGLPPDATMTAALLSAMETDADASVKLLLASMLLSRSDAQARAHIVLHALLASAGMIALQAAATLAKEVDRDAMHVLAQGLRDPNPAFRSVSARAVAREALLPDLVRRALGDEDASVRITTAGAILSAASAL